MNVRWLGLMLLLGAAAPSAAALTEWGAAVNGFVLPFCSSPNFICSGTAGNAGNGGAEQLSASAAVTPPIDFSFSGVPFSIPDVAWNASVALNGNLELPELKSHAEAGGSGTRRVLARAKGVQGIVYDGSGPKEFTLDVALTANLSGNARATGRIFVVNAANLDFEMEPEDFSGFGVTQVVPALILNGAQSGSLTFTLNPNDEVYLWAELVTEARSVTGQSDPSIADASHTLTMNFENGDGLIQARLAAVVPEPSSAWLFLLGIAAAGLIRLQRAARGD